MRDETFYRIQRARRHIINTPVRRELIRKLMIADKSHATPSNPVWTYEQWDSLLMKDLLTAWKEWGKTYYNKYYHKNAR